VHPNNSIFKDADLQKKTPKNPSKILADDAYFKEARQWFTDLYIAPISNRGFFLVISIFALFSLFVVFIAMLGFMPLRQEAVLVVNNPRIDEVIIEAQPLRLSGMELNEAFKNFMVAHYVIMREAYKAKDWESQQAFVRAHSDDLIIAAYNAATAETNPNSYRASLQRVGERLITINHIRISYKEDLYEAVVSFTAEFKNVTNLPQSSWTATLRFQYKNTESVQVNSIKGDSKKITTILPLFKVVSYAVVQNR
jgi:type IV secretory pathway component VirB8